MDGGGRVVGGAGIYIPIFPIERIASCMYIDVFVITRISPCIWDV